MSPELLGRTRRSLNVGLTPVLHYTFLNPARS